MTINYRQREHVTKFLKLQSEALAESEALLEQTKSQEARDELCKIQHGMVNLQNRFTRLVYLTGEVSGE
jgi:hypothetical protein